LTALAFRRESDPDDAAIMLPVADADDADQVFDVESVPLHRVDLHKRMPSSWTVCARRSEFAAPMRSAGLSAQATAQIEHGVQQ